MTAPWCCLIAVFEGYENSHERVCPWAAARRPQVETLPGTDVREATDA